MSEEGELRLDETCPECEEDELVVVEKTWGRAEWCLKCDYENLVYEEEEDDA